MGSGREAIAAQEPGVCAFTGSMTIVNISVRVMIIEAAVANLSNPDYPHSYDMGECLLALSEEQIVLQQEHLQHQAKIRLFSSDLGILFS